MCAGTEPTWIREGECWTLVSSTGHCWEVRQDPWSGEWIAIETIYARRELGAERTHHRFEHEIQAKGWCADREREQRRAA